ncbi:hypothetical protein P3342_011792 [Pyrenophora teres f. teres]|nr:hypothetical protein P3342_011792 [Pyrenophora teres f. teres]
MDSPRAWNYEIPGVTNKCIHDLFAEQVLAQPNAPAICAWDGKMSYSVLDNLSTTLAGYLVKIGVKPEDVVPLCFEKSMWTVVAMLAVLKAGGAFAQLDPDHPASRHKEILRQTSARVLINGYGPTECCIVCAGYTTTQAFTTGTIGRAIASVSWVVDPENHHRLAPLGSVGELLVEGPILARGYLNDAEKTAAAFIEDPAWLMDGCQGYAGRHGRLYKTGDLVQYNDDGNLVCVGRKDSQVKLRGQRIELGEIEHHLRECLPEAT